MSLCEHTAWETHLSQARWMTTSGIGPCHPEAASHVQLGNGVALLPFGNRLLIDAIALASVLRLA